MQNSKNENRDFFWQYNGNFFFLQQITVPILSFIQQNVFRLFCFFFYNETNSFIFVENTQNNV